MKTKTSLFTHQEPYVDDKMGIFIPGEVYSSKNSKQIRPIFSKAGEETNWQIKIKGRWRYIRRPFIMDSDAVKNYKDKMLPVYNSQRNNWFKLINGIELPIIVQLTFARSTRAKWDFNNISQLVQDMMVASGWISDDDVENILPTPPIKKPHYLFQKDDPGVFIKPLGKSYDRDLI